MGLRCKHCETPIKRPKGAGRGRPSAFCSDSCRQERRRKKWREYGRKKNERARKEKATSVRTCHYCQGEFIYSEGRNKYCSDECARKQTSRDKNAARRARLNRVDYESPVSPAELALRDGPTCCHCKEFFTPEKIGEVDHIIPLSRGGVHAGYNCQLLCSACNNAKGNRVSLKDLQKARQLWPATPVLTDRDPRRAVLSRKKRPKTGYRGVSEHRDTFNCKLQFDGHIFRKGGFETAEAAALHYNFLCELVGLGPEYQNEVVENEQPEETRQRASVARHL